MLSNQYKSAVLKAVDVCEAVANGDLEARILNITEKGEAGRLLHAINRLIDRSDAYVRESKASLEYVAENKYFRRISEKGMTGTFGDASRAVNKAMESMEQRVNAFARVVHSFEGQMNEVVWSRWRPRRRSWKHPPARWKMQPLRQASNQLPLQRRRNRPRPM